MKMICRMMTMAAFALTLPVVAQAQPWTATPAAAVAEPAAQGLYDVSLSSLTYSSANSSSAITFYYNVTDTTATGNPSWDTLEVRYFDNTATSDNFVRASLYQISSTGSATLLSSCTSTESASPAQRQCNFTSGAVNFNAGNTYVVRVTLDRSSSLTSMIFYGAQIF